MYLRWRTDRLKSGGVSFRADVLRAYRDPLSGRPTSQLVACLGSIRESDLASAARRETFWLGVEAKLRRLGLPPHEERKIRIAVGARVIRPRNIAALLAARFGSRIRPAGASTSSATATSVTANTERELSAAELLLELQHRLGENPLT